MMSNFRDAGGLATSDGRRMRNGVLFRSDAPDNIAFLTQHGIRLVCDLREHKRPLTWNGPMRYANVPIPEASRLAIFGCLFGRSGGGRFQALLTGYYRNLVLGHTAATRQVFDLLADGAHWPVLVHCTAGKDRTGFLISLLQTLAGVPYGAVLENYLETNERFSERREVFYRKLRRLTLWQVSRERMDRIALAPAYALDAAHEAIRQRHGDVETYLRDGCGIAPETLAAVRERLV